MTVEVCRDAAYAPSRDVVFREIEGEAIIVPLTASVGDMENVLFTLNETGRVVWDALDGVRTVADIVAALGEEYEGDVSALETDVAGFLAELLARGIVVETAT